MVETQAGEKTLNVGNPTIQGNPTANWYASKNTPLCRCYFLYRETHVNLPRRVINFNSSSMRRSCFSKARSPLATSTEQRPFSRLVKTSGILCTRGDAATIFPFADAYGRLEARSRASPSLGYHDRCVFLVSERGTGAFSTIPGIIAFQRRSRRNAIQPIPKRYSLDGQNIAVSIEQYSARLDQVTHNRRDTHVSIETNICIVCFPILSPYKLVQLQPDDMHVRRKQEIILKSMWANLESIPRR